MRISFNLNDEEVDRAKSWLEEHNKTCKLFGKYGGAIGGRFSYIFTDTSIGQLATFKCSCGAHVLLNGDNL